jgi:hypothetical protein
MTSTYSVGVSYLRVASEVARKPARVSELELPPPSFAHLLRISDDPFQPVH